MQLKLISKSIIKLRYGLKMLHRQLCTHSVLQASWKLCGFC